jgi:hypothetical protein
VKVAERELARVVVKVAAIEAIGLTDLSALAVASVPPVVVADPHAHAVVRTLLARMMFALAVSATTIAATAIGLGALMATAR